MALSFCSNNWPCYSNSLHQNLNPDTVVFPQRKKPRSSSSSSLSFSNTYSFNILDPLILQTNNNDHHNHSFFSNPTNDNNTFISALSPQSLFPLEYYDQDYDHNIDNYAGFYGNPYSDYPEFFSDNGLYASNYPGLIPEYDNHDIDELLLGPLIGEPQENVINCGYNYNQQTVTSNSSDEVKKTTSSKVVSPQSIAARERRRKTTEKTQELGKLIPGGSKMTTAEMFQAASKYVKFLQAQVAVLKVIFPLFSFSFSFLFLIDYIISNFLS